MNDRPPRLRNTLLLHYTVLWGGSGSTQHRLATGLTGEAVAAVSNLVILYGAFRLRRLQNYRLVYATAVLTAIPHTSPVLWLGPLAGGSLIWIITRPQFRSAFHDPVSQAEARAAVDRQLVHRSGAPYLLGVVAAMLASVAIHWAIGCWLLTQTEWRHRLAWPLLAYFQTLVTEICIFAGLYFYLRKRQDHYQAVRGMFQGPLYLWGLTGFYRPRDFRASLFTPGLMAAGLAAFFSFSAQPADTLWLTTLWILLGSCAWGLFATLMLTGGYTDSQ
jgi:hypothetical protein